MGVKVITPRMQVRRGELEEMMSERGKGCVGGVCRPNADSCRPWRGLYFLSVMGALGGFCAEEGCDLACVLRETLVAECRTNFREAEME